MNSRTIVISTTDFNTGGLGTYLINLIEGLKQRSWIVHLIVTNDRGNLYEIMSKTISCHDLSGIPLSQKKVMMAANLLNEIGPDILMLNNCSLIHYCLPLLTSHIKPVAVLHSDDLRFYATATMFSSRIFRWIAPTKGVAKKLRAYLPDAFSKRLRIVPHGVDTQLFHFVRKNNKEFDQTLCFIGYIAENKGVDLFPDIMKRVLALHSNAHLRIVGYGPMAEKLKKVFKEKNLSKKCSFDGTLSRAQVADILKSSDILLSPTRIEGFGLSIIEAMMAGVVPVASRLEGITDFIIDDGLTGILVEPNDVDGFADAVIKLFDDTVKLQSISDAAQKAALEKYSMGRMLNEYEEIFREKDDRGELPRRSKIGWYKETIAEVMKKGVDHKWLVKRAQELFK